MMIIPLFSVEEGKTRKWKSDHSQLNARQCPVPAGRSISAPEIGEASGYRRQKTSDDETSVDEIDAIGTDVDDILGKV